MTFNDQIIKWPSFDNIHKDIKVIDKLGYFTIKTDGSNFSIHIIKISDTWKIQSINSRNFSIWPKDECKLNEINTTFGYLEDLPIQMLKISILIANKLNIDEIIIFGELFRAKKNNIHANFISWHPFGYYISTFKQPVIFLPDFLNEICPIPIDIIDNGTMIDYLMNADSHKIFPSKCMFYGIISEGIKELSTIMLNSQSDFEGFFIILNENNGYKWKTHWHEEQPKLNKYKYNIDKDIYEIFNKIFVQKNERKNDDEILKEKINQSLNKTINKYYIINDNSNIDIDKLIILILEEFQSHYIDCNCEIPWSVEKIEKQSRNCVKKYLKK